MTLKISTAALSIDIEGAFINPGKEKMRLDLVKGDPRVSVAAKSITQSLSLWDKIGLALGRYKLITDANQNQLLVNINSVASRLHLNKPEIDAVTTLEQLTNLAQRVSKEVSPIFHQYETILKDFDENNHSFTLMQKIKRAQASESDSLIVFKKRKYILPKPIETSSDKNESVYELKKSIGKGGCATVYALRDVEKNEETTALKMIKANRSSKNEAENECFILNKVHENKNVIGILPKPKKVVTLQGFEPGYGEKGFLMEKCDRDLYEDIEQNPNGPIENKLFDCYQLLSGLKSLQEKNILHGDIKLANTLKKGNRCYISDFGGAKQFISSTPMAHLQKMLFTQDYVAKKDALARATLIKQNQTQELIELEKKRDVFAMGFALYQFLEKLDPYYRTLDGYCNAKKETYEKMSNAHVPLEVQMIIREMLDPDYKTRISAAEAFESFEKYLKTSQPLVMEKIRTEFPNR